VYPRLEKVIFVSSDAAASTEEVVTLDASRVEVIPNSLDPLAVETVQRTCQTWDHPFPAKPVVMAVGRLNPEKGFDLLIRAHRRLRDMGVEHSLVILGEGPLRAELTELVKELRVADSVIMPGFFPNPYTALKQATLCVLSSHFEGCPSVLLEALALGVPIVATRCFSGPREILDEGKYGMLVPPNDEAALTEAIGKLLNDPARRKQLRLAGLERIRQYFPANIAPRWDRLFTEILAGGGSKSGGFAQTSSGASATRWSQKAVCR
jgi:glycosyltransferase involved in cell wall biosynthesis